MGVSYAIHRHSDIEPKGVKLLPVAKVTLPKERSVRDHLHVALRGTSNTDGCWALHLGRDAHPEVEVLQPCYEAGQPFDGLRSSMDGDLIVTPEGEPLVLVSGSFEPLSPELIEGYGYDLAELDLILVSLPTLQVPPINTMISIASAVGSAARLGLEVSGHSNELGQARYRFELASALSELFRAAYLTAPDAQTLYGLLYLGEQAERKSDSDRILGPEQRQSANLDYLEQAYCRLKQLSGSLRSAEGIEFMANAEALLNKLGRPVPEPEPEPDFGW